MPKTKQSSFFSFFYEFKENTRKYYLNLLLASLFAGFFALIVVTVFYMIYYYFVVNSSPDTFLGIQFTYVIANYLLILILASIVQIITIKIFFEPGLKIVKMANDIKANFWKFLGLSIILNVLFLLCSLPVYVSIILFISQNYLLSLVALLVGILLLLLFTSYVMFSPFILIEKQPSIYHALKESMDLASSNIWGVIIKLVILIVGMVALNYLASMLIGIPYVGEIIESFAIILFSVLFILYIFSIYQDLKKTA